jgi:neutral trehalase
MSRNAFAQCERDYNERQDAIETAKYEREQMNLRDFELTKQHLTSDAFLHELWALAQGGPARDAIAAMRAFIEANLK